MLEDLLKVFNALKGLPVGFHKPSRGIVRGLGPHFFKAPLASCAAYPRIECLRYIRARMPERVIIEEVH